MSPNLLRTFLVLLFNELRTLLRARIALFWVFVFPFCFLAMMLVSYGGHSVFGNVVIEAVDLDNSVASRSYLASLRNIFESGDPIFGSVVVGDPKQAPKADVVRVTMPHGFGQAVGSGQPVKVLVQYDFAGGIATQVASKVFKPLTIYYNAEVNFVPMNVALAYDNTGSKSTMDFSLYMLTGILVMSMMTAGMNSTCIAIADMRERNTFKFMSMLPMRPSLYLAATLVARLVMLFISSIVLLFGARYVFSLPVPIDASRLANASVVLLTGGSMLIAAGMALSSRIRTVATAVFICNFVYLVLLFGSDLTMPLSSLSGAARDTLAALPVAQFVSALREVLLGGSSLQSVGARIGILLLWAFGFALLARLMFFWHKS